MLPAVLRAVAHEHDVCVRSGFPGWWPGSSRPRTLRPSHRAVGGDANGRGETGIIRSSPNLLHPKPLFLLHR